MWKFGDRAGCAEWVFLWEIVNEASLAVKTKQKNLNYEDVVNRNASFLSLKKH